MQRFTLSHLQTGSIVSTLHTLDATQKATDLYQAPDGAIFLTVYRDSHTVSYRIAPDGYVRETPNIPA